MGLKQSFNRLFPLSKKSQEDISIIESLPIPIFWIDHELTYVGCSQVYADILGLSSTSDVINKKDHELNVPERTVASRQSLFHQILSGKSSGGVLYDCVENKGGNPTWIQTRCTPAIKDQNVVGVLGIVKDITESALTQRRLAKSSLQDAQVYQLMQEINETCLLTNDHREIAHKTTNSIKLLFDAEHVMWTSRETRSSHLKVDFCVPSSSVQTLSDTLVKNQQSGFLPKEDTLLFESILDKEISSIFFFQLISTKRPEYHDIIFLVNPNKTDLEHLKTIWQVTRRVTDRLYIFKNSTSFRSGLFA